MTGGLLDEAAARAVLDEVIAAETGLRLPLDANFFESGIDSAALLRVHAVLARLPGTDISVTDLFGYPNRRALARRLAGPRRAGPSAPPAAPVVTGSSPERRRSLRAQIRAGTQLRATEGGQP
ncbi:acyl carrier protein [Actinoplanes sp. NPDC026619]|uniref:acyl carrier protein n=1 Tax=Actinoplanes sp. NPDC026619 TaxID=3155798 RepID=UPI003401E5EC